jgi:HD-GYP domain-containing protein (c-di-GMP phosphodiesterase class II)
MHVKSASNSDHGVTKNAKKYAKHQKRSVSNVVKKKTSIFENIKERKLDASESIIQILVNECHNWAKEKLNDVYLLSISLVVDDIFEIYFSQQEDTNNWTKYASTKYGHISYYCNLARKNNERVIAHRSQREVHDMYFETQRYEFEQSPIKAFFIAPLILNDTLIGSIQLSFRSEINEKKQFHQIEKFLNDLNNEIIWIVYSEYNKVFVFLMHTKSILGALESIDEYQSTHSINVSKLAKAICIAINYDKKELYKADELPDDINVLELYYAGLLHDIGKITMRVFDLNKNTDAYIDFCKRVLHPYFSYIITNKISYTAKIADIIAFHHERFDGGYIEKGKMASDEQNIFLRRNDTCFENISIAILQFADVIDSYMRERPFMEKRKAFDEINDLINTQRFREKFLAKNLDILEKVFRRIRDHQSQAIPKVVYEEIDELLGITQKYRLEKLENNNPLYEYMNSYLKSFQKYHWLLIYAFKCDKEEFAKNIQNNSDIQPGNTKDEYSITVKGSKEFKSKFFRYNDELFVGCLKIGKPAIITQTGDIEKEFIVQFCNKLVSMLSGVNVSSAIMAYSMICDADFKNCLKKCLRKLEEKCDNAYAGTWQLLRHDIQTKEWK